MLRKPLTQELKVRQTATRRFALHLFSEITAPFSFRYRAYVVAWFVLGLSALLTPAFFLLFAQYLTRAPSVEMTWLMPFALVGLGVATVLLLAKILSTVLDSWMRFSIETSLRRRILHRLQTLPLATLDREAGKDWLLRTHEDLSIVEGFLTKSIPSQIRALAFVLGTLAVFIFSSGALALISIVAAILLAAAHVAVAPRIAELRAEKKERHRSVYQLLVEAYSGVRTIRSHVVGPYLERRFETRAREGEGSLKTLSRGLGLWQGGETFLSQILATAVLSLIGWSLHVGSLTVAQALVYPLFLGLVYRAARDLANSATEWETFFTVGGRLAEFLYLEPETGFLSEAPRHLENAERIRVKDLYVGYEGSKPLGPLTAEFWRGKVWALVGPSGVGKSTLLDVLAGLRAPLRGAAIYEGPLGERLWQLTPSVTPRAFGGACAYVEQKPYLFEGTLRENLVFQNQGRCSDAVLWESLERLGLYGLVTHRGGLDFQVSEGGKNLSEGERYRLAICRALLLDRPFILLDEPFASLDSESTRLVIATLDEVRAKAALILVTHYLPEALELDGVIHFDGSGVLVLPNEEEEASAPRGPLDGSSGVTGTVN